MKLREERWIRNVSIGARQTLVMAAGARTTRLLLVYVSRAVNAHEEKRGSHVEPLLVRTIKVLLVLFQYCCISSLFSGLDVEIISSEPMPMTYGG